MNVPITTAELEQLIRLSANRLDPRVIPLTHTSSEHGSFAIESEAIGADWALAELALLRANPRRSLDDLADSFQQVLFEEYHSLTTGQDERAANRMAEAAFALLYPKGN
jgi:hypothetical protein